MSLISFSNCARVSSKASGQAAAGERCGGRLQGGELLLQRLGLAVGVLPRPRFGLDVQAARPGLGGHPLEDEVVEVHAAQPAVPAGGQHRHAPVRGDLHHGHVERAAAQVEDEDPPAAPVVQTVRDSGGGWLVHDVHDLEAGDLPSRLGRRALVVAEVRGDGDHHLADRLAEPVLGHARQFLQHRGRQFLRRQGLPVHHERPLVVQEGLLAHAAFEQHRDPLGFDDRPLPGARPDKLRGVLAEVHHRRHDPVAVLPGDHLGGSRWIGVGDHGVRGAQVDPEDPIHLFQ